VLDLRALSESWFVSHAKLLRLSNYGNIFSQNCRMGADCE
jgi:hypothetical protein